MKKVFSIKSILVLLIIVGVIFIISGISSYQDKKQIMDWLGGAANPVFNYSNEIEGACYILTGTVFIVSGLYLMVRLKELS